MCDVFVVITFERFEIKKKKKKKKKNTFEILDNIMHVQNLKFLAQQFGLLLIKNEKRLVNK